MYEEVESDWNPLNGGSSNNLREAKNGSQSMVINVQEFQILLLENQENSVDQFVILEAVINVIIKNKSFVVPHLFRANTPEKAMSPNAKTNTFDDKKQKNQTSSTKRKIMRNKETLKLQWFERFHNVLQRKDNYEVTSDRNNNLFNG
jgi:hypothetical protein